MHEIFDEADKNGLDITYNMYPYTAAGAGLDQMIPLWAHSGGIDEFLERLKDSNQRSKIREEVKEGRGGLAPKWETVILSSSNNDKNKQLIGMSIIEIAQKRKIHPA